MEKPTRVNAARVQSGDPDWKRAQSEIYNDQKSLDAQLAKLGKGELQRFVLRKGEGRRSAVALTFDDGPHPAFTLKLLDILREEGVPATFFIVGFMADKYPSLVKAIKAAGHEVGNHTYSHVTLTRLPRDQALVEYKANNDVILRLTGSRARYCRPPGGDFSINVVEDAASLGLTTVLWTDDPGDYADPGDQKLYDREVRKLSKGAIILLHDGSQDTLETLAKFIRTAKDEGYRFVTLDALRGG